jgi:hypothetical protein
MKKLTIAKDQTTNQCGMNWEAVCQLNAGNAPDGASTTQRRTQNFGEKESEKKVKRNGGESALEQSYTVVNLKKTTISRLNEVLKHKTAAEPGMNSEATASGANSSRGAVKNK